MKSRWIVAISCSECDGVDIYKFVGTVDEIKEKLFELVIADKNEDVEKWEYGTESAEDVQSYACDIELYAYGSYRDYHIDYSAKLEEQITEA